MSGESRVKRMKLRLSQSIPFLSGFNASVEIFEKNEELGASGVQYDVSLIGESSVGRGCTGIWCLTATFLSWFATFGQCKLRCTLPPELSLTTLS